MSLFDVFKRGPGVPQPVSQEQFSLARLLGQQAYDTDPIRTDGDALKSYQGWVYACVSTISQDVRTAEWKIWNKTGAGREDWKALDEAQVPEVLMRPSLEQTWGDLIELTQVHLDLAGRAFWHLICNAPGGKVVGIQSINPDWINKAVYQDDRMTLKGWEIAVSGSTRRLLPAEDVIMFRYPDPVNPHAGMSPIRAVAMSHDMDTYARAYASSHLRNHAQPTGILTTESELTKEQAGVLSESWQDSHQGTSRIQVLGKGAQFQVLSAHIKDLEFLNLARVSRDQILSAYHMPASKLGLVEDSSRANGEEADRVYSALCLGPRLRRYQEPITYRLLPRLGLDPAGFAFEFDPVEVGDKEFDRISAEMAFQRGAITMDEYRERIGFDPEANGKGALYFIPLGAKLVSDLDEAGPAEVPEPLQGFEPIAPEPDEDEAELDEERFLLRISEEVSKLPLPTNLEEAEPVDPSDERQQISALRFLAVQGEGERRMKGRIRAVFSKMQKRVVAAAKDGSLARALVPSDSERNRNASVEDRSPVLPHDLLDDFNVELQAILAEEAELAFGAGHEAFASEVASTVAPSTLIKYDLISDQVKAWAKREAATKIVGINEATVKDVRKILLKSLEEGEGIDKLAKRLATKFDEYKGVRAETIARTETAGSYNHGKFNNAEQFDLENAGLRVVKTWVPTQDERTRDDHKSSAIRTADGKSRRSVFRDQAFMVGGERMMHPLDPNASAKQVVRCRCTLTFAVAEGSREETL